jgi:predicted transcriptional regulator/DNA-binding XRE family transcriptional regulator
MGLNHKVIFGMKLRQFRERAGLSLTDLGSKTNLSTSYLTEIEHGKKYPKAEKIARMAEVLGRSYDDLVSLRLDEQLSPLSSFLASPVLHGFPYHLFGISPAQVIEILTRQPAEASALVNALFAIAEQYNIGVEHLYRSALRSYQELHENYFPEIERAVDEFAKANGLKENPTPSHLELRKLIEKRFGYRLDETSLSRHQRLQRFRSVLVTKPRQGPSLLINPALTELQRKFVLAREIGYQVLDLRERAMTSAPERVDSFEQVLNDFKASYFAGALLANRDLLLGDLRKLFSLERWRPERVRALLDRYEVTPEVFMYRLTELLPRYFGIKLHFLRFNHDGGEYRLVKHLNMSQVLMPSGAGVNEHHCRRWLAIRVLSKLEAPSNGHASREPLIDSQLSRFVDNDSRYLCIAIARRLTLKPKATSSVSVGFRFEEGFERTVRFANDSTITSLDIDGTCERCRLTADQCHDRAAPPVLFELQQSKQEIEAELASL